VLEEALALPPDGFTARLAATLSLERLDMAALRRAARSSICCPSTSARSAAARCCARKTAPGARVRRSILGRAAGLGRGAHRAALHWARAPRHLVAFLAGHEESLRALDSLEEEAPVTQADSGRVEDLSLRAIGDESSEVVRLVRSTCATR